LHEADDYQDSFRRYEGLMQPYVESRQKNPRDFTKAFVPESPLGLMVQQFLLSVGWK
jgi:2-polyprenyl-6-methoxyphenol hydroxylase-like FAD-dependent oxidoreductase